MKSHIGSVEICELPKQDVWRSKGGARHVVESKTARSDARDPGSQGHQRNACRWMLTAGCARNVALRCSGFVIGSFTNAARCREGVSSVTPFSSRGRAPGLACQRVRPFFLGANVAWRARGTRDPPDCTTPTLRRAGTRGAITAMLCALHRLEVRKLRTC